MKLAFIITPNMIKTVQEHRSRQPEPGSYIMTPVEVKVWVKKLEGVAKAAREMGVSRSTMYRWLKTGIRNPS